MNKTLTALKEFLAPGTGFEHLLLVPNKSMGAQLLDSLAREDGGIMGLRVETPASLAVELCSRSGQARPVLTDNQAVLLVLDQMTRVMQDHRAKLPYFRSLGQRCLTADTACALLQVFYLLEEAGMTPGGKLLDPIPGSADSDRLQDVGRLYAAYVKAKQKQGLWDRYDLYAQALVCLEQTPIGYPVAACSNLTLRGDARRLVEKLAPTVLPVPHLDLVKLPEDPWFLPQTAAASSLAPTFHKAHGPENQALFPLYDLLEKKHPLGEVAILCPRTTLYPLLRDYGLLLGLPMTFETGVPLSTSPLAQLLELLLDWAQQRFPLSGLSDLVRDGLGLFYSDGLLKLLRENGVSLDSQPYLELLDRVACQTGALRDSTDDSTPDGKALKAGLEKRLEHLDRWSSELETLFGLLEPSVTPQEGVGPLLTFLTDHYVSRSPESRSVEYTCVRDLAIQLLPHTRETSLTGFLRSLLLLAQRTPWNASRPRDGAIHVAPLTRAAALDRPFVYVIDLGLDSLDRAPAESPLLRDEERTALGLRVSHTDHAMPLQQLAVALAQRTPRQLSLSYSCYDPDKDIALPPSPFYLELGGNPSQDPCFHYLHGTGFTPADAWVHAKAPVPPALPPRVIPDLPQFMKTHVFSASALETGLECPKRYYYRHILGIREPVQPKSPQDGWLSANELGLLVHSVLESYFNRVILRNTPDLEALLDQQLLEARQHIPCYNNAELQLVRDNALEMCRRELALYDKAAATDRKAVACELSFGTAAKSVKLVLNSCTITTPADLTLNIGGRQLHLQGSIDRLDQLPNGHYCVVDYKTGSYYRFRSALDRKLQYFLYAKAVEKMIPNAVVDQVEYHILSMDPPVVISLDKLPSMSNRSQLMSVLLDALADHDKVRMPFPEWTLGGPVSNFKAADRNKRIRSCDQYCPFSTICSKEVPDDN